MDKTYIICVIIVVIFLYTFSYYLAYKLFGTIDLSIIQNNNFTKVLLFSHGIQSPSRYVVHFLHIGLLVDSLV